LFTVAIFQPFLLWFSFFFHFSKMNMRMSSKIQTPTQPSRGKREKHNVLYQYIDFVFNPVTPSHVSSYKPYFFHYFLQQLPKLAAERG